MYGTPDEVLYNDLCALGNELAAMNAETRESEAGATDGVDDARSKDRKNAHIQRQKQRWRLPESESWLTELQLMRMRHRAPSNLLSASATTGNRYSM